MSDPKQQEQDAGASWKALQAELGLASEEPELKSQVPAREEPAPKPPAAKPPASKRRSDARPAEPPLPFESPFGEGLILTAADTNGNLDVPVPQQAEGDAGQEHDVEVGEAPEEIPDTEVESEEEKRPRRRRGRRRRRSEGSGSSEEAAEEREALAEPASEDEEGEEAGDDEEQIGEDEAEPERFADWNVPSWQELIGSLYRPER